MKKIISFLLVAILFLGLGIYGGNYLNSKNNNEKINSVVVTGDVPNEFILKDFDGFDTIEIEYKDLKLSAIRVSDILEKTGVCGRETEIFYLSNDNVMASTPLNNVDDEDYLLAYNGSWMHYSQKYPPQASIRDISKIVISSKEIEDEQRCFRFVNGLKVISQTYGDIFKAEKQTFCVLEGEAQKNNASTNSYTLRSLIPLSSYADKVNADMNGSAVGYFENGSIKEISLGGFIEWRGNSVDYIDEDLKGRISNIAGIVCGIKESNMKLATDVQEIAKDKRVLIIELDAAGYYNISEIRPPFISSKDIQKVRTTLPSISNVGLAMLVSGKTPYDNGITEKGMRNITGGDVFQNLAEDGISSVVVEGDVALVTMSLEQKLNIDNDGDGITDDEVHQSALEEVHGDKQVVFVHYHGFDDYAHEFGPHSKQAEEKMMELDNYVKELCDDFIGEVIIVADHGQHDSENPERPGIHGTLLPYDITVPYIRFACN